MLPPEPRSGNEPRLLANLMYFVRALRAAGLPVGPGKLLDAVAAVRAVGIGDRRDFYWTLHAVLVNRREQRELFDQIFHVFWRNPRLLQRMLQLVLPAIDAPAGEPEPQMSPRVAEALGARNETAREVDSGVEIDATLTFSASEVLKGMDFEKMSNAEVAAAEAAIRRMRIALKPFPIRRFRPDAAGKRVDMRATLRAIVRSGDVAQLSRKAPRLKRPPLVVLCDISGSMGRYTRLFLHFLHTLANDTDRVHTFLFGTRLTNISRQLRHRDIDLALERVAGAVEDWSGGTRIGHTLQEFNRVWARRVLGQGAVVLLITDGLDRDAGYGLETEMARLHRSCRRLIWLNPLLRYDAFEPRSSGMRAMLPHVDEFRPVHSLDSLDALAAALASTAPRRLEAASGWNVNP